MFSRRRHSPRSSESGRTATGTDLLNILCSVLKQEQMAAERDKEGNEAQQRSRGLRGELSFVDHHSRPHAGVSQPYRNMSFYALAICRRTERVVS